METIKERFAEWNDFTKEGVLAFIAQELTLLAQECEAKQGWTKNGAPLYTNIGLRDAAAIIRAHVKDLEK